MAERVNLDRAAGLFCAASPARLTRHHAARRIRLNRDSAFAGNALSLCLRRMPYRSCSNKALGSIPDPHSPAHPGIGRSSKPGQRSHLVPRNGATAGRHQARAIVSPQAAPRWPRQARAVVRASRGPRPPGFPRCPHASPPQRWRQGLGPSAPRSARLSASWLHRNA